MPTVVDLAEHFAQRSDPTIRARRAIAALADPRRVVPFIEGRVQKTSKDKRRGQLIAFLPGRVVQQVMDDVIGATRYDFEIVDEPHLILGSGRLLSVKGRITVHLPDGTTAYREDSGTGKLRLDDRGEIEETSLDAAYKGCITDCFKRCAVLFGVGRCLYSIPEDPDDTWRDWCDLDQYKTPDPVQYAKVIRAWQNAILSTLAPTIAAPAVSPRAAYLTGAASEEEESGKVAEPPADQRRTEEDGTEADAARTEQDAAAEEQETTSTTDDGAVGEGDGDVPSPPPEPAKPARTPQEIADERNVLAGNWTVDGVGSITTGDLRTVIAHCGLTAALDLADDETWAWCQRCLTAAVKGEDLPPRDAAPQEEKPAQTDAPPPAPPKPPTEARTQPARPAGVAPANAGKPMTEAQARLLALLEQKVGKDTALEANNGEPWDAKIDLPPDAEGEVKQEYALRRAYASTLISTLQKVAVEEGAVPA